MFDDFLLNVEVCVGVVDGWIIPFIQSHSKFTSNFRQNLSKSADFAVDMSLEKRFERRYRGGRSLLLAASFSKKNACFDQNASLDVDLEFIE